MNSIFCWANQSTSRYRRSISNWLTLAAQNPLTLGALVVPVIGIAAYPAMRRSVKPVPELLRWWGPTYLVYMLAVTKPNAGIIRYVLLSILPMSPLLEARSKNGRAAVAIQWLVTAQFLVIGVVGQYFWVMHVFTIDTAPELQFHP